MSDAAHQEHDGRGLRRTLLACGLVALVALAYWPALSAQFVNWDDPGNLADLRASAGDPWRFWHTTGAVDPYQPLSWWSLKLDAALWGLSPNPDATQTRGFHATSVALQALAALAFFALARRVLALALRSSAARARDLAAALAACVFAIHPLRVESVAWVTERRDVLSGLFYVLAAYAWLRAVPRETPSIRSRGAALACVVATALSLAAFFGSVERPADGPLRWIALGPFGLAAGGVAMLAAVVFAARATGRSSALAAWFALAVACFFAALFAKALTVVLPLVLLVLDVWPLKRAQRSAWTALALEKLPLFGLALVAGSLAAWAQVRTGEALADWSSHSLGERLAQAAYGLAFYVSRTLAPHGLLPAYALPDEISFTDARFALSVLGVVIAAVALIALRKRWPAALAAAAAFAVAVAPVLGLSQAGPQLAADRYAYLSCMPFALLAGGAALVASERSARARVATTLLGIAVVLALVLATRAQTRVWRDSESLWTHALAVEPDNPIAHAMLAAVRDEQADAAGDPAVRRELLLETDRLYRRALELDPTPIATHVRNFGTNLLRLERPEAAVEPLARYVAMRPDDPAGHTNYGLALRMLGRGGEGLEHLRRAVALDADNAKSWNQLALALEASGDHPGAIAALEQVARLWPKHEPTRQKLAQLRGG